jgi:hypothetical protein
MACERRVWLFVMASTALLWTHPWGVFVWLASAAMLCLPVHTEGLLGHPRLNKNGFVPRPPLDKGGLHGDFQRRWHALLFCLLSLVLAAPTFWHFTQPSLFGVFWARRPDFQFLHGVVEALGGGPFFVGGWQFFPGWSGELLFMTFVLLWVTGLLKEDVHHTRQKLLLGLVGLFLAPAVVGWLAPEASAHQRYWLATLPVAVLLAARGWEGLPASFRAAVCFVLLAGLLGSNVHYFRSWQKGNVLQAVTAVREGAAPGTILIIPRYLQPLWKYHDSGGLPVTDEMGVNELAPVIDQHSRAILVTLDVPNPVRDALDSRYTILDRVRFPAASHLGLVVTSYAKR